MKSKKLPPIHPGEILWEEFMNLLGLSHNGLARALHLPPRWINEIVLEKRLMVTGSSHAGSSTGSTKSTSSIKSSPAI
jgi:plasmid maintenance system antidote protein VapI